MSKKLDESKQTPQLANVNPKKKKILDQYIKEKDWAVKVRQVKVGVNWMMNEEAYNGVVRKTLLTRSNLHVPVVFEAVQNMSSKLGQRPDLSFDTIPEGDENAADIMKHVVQEDLDECYWDTLYDESKIEAGIYGRAIYKVIPGNDKNKVEVIDTLAYLISPIAKNTRDALYQGQQFIYKTIEQIEEEAKEMEYDEEEIKKLKENKVPNETQVDTTTEASTKNLRLANMGLSNTTQYGSKVAELTEWWTYLDSKTAPDAKGKKRELYCLLVANDLYLLRCKKASELGLKRPPFISWGAFTRGAVTFWCPSMADIYRDPNLAIDVSINQGIDNNTYRNFGMMFVASSSGLKQSSIVPRPLGVTAVTCAPTEKVQDKVWQFTPPEVTSALTTMNTVKGFADSASGLSPGISQNQKGQGKISVSQQAKMNADVEMRNMVMRRNATLACQELYQLMADITKDKLTKPRQVKIFGLKNLTIDGVTKKNFEGVGLVAKAIPAEDSQQNKAIKQKAVIDLYTIFKDDPKIPGQVALRRSVAKKFDVDMDEVQSWFEKEEMPEGMNLEQGTPVPNTDPNARPTDNAPTDSSALLRATQKGAQSNVPPAIPTVMSK